MATHADGMEFAGEFGCVADGTLWNCPSAMGSGYQGTSGYPYAAYQRQMWYFDGAYNVNPATSLAGYSQCPGATSVLGPYWDGVGDFGVYFFFGGPGGYCPRD
jgi:hypothetical protein